MSGGRMSEAASIASLALEVHRQPARHAELLRGFAPLPAGVSALLRLAGGTALAELEPRLASLAPEGELRKAALFFIEQVLFQRDATHYRVLGINPGATQEQIKEHHRLLMRLFHPDRDTQLGETREHYATRANLAYNTLRDAGSRADYDATLKPQAAPSMQTPIRPQRRAAPKTWRRRPEPESFWTVRVYPLLMRYLPQWVLAGTALVSVSVVGTVYLFNSPVRLPPPSPSLNPAADSGKMATAMAASGTEVRIAATDSSRLDAVVADFERKIVAARDEIAAAPAAVAPITALPPVSVLERAPVASPPPPAPKLPPAPAAIPRHSTAVLAAPVPRPGIAAAAVPVAISQPVVQESPRSSPSPAPAAEPARPAVVAAVLVSTQAVESPPPPDPNTLLSRFLEAYERGDVQTCMSLLDDDMRSNAGGKPELRREYDALFRGTDLRHLKILNMSWARDGEFIRGEGRYRATLMRKGETLLRTQDGQVRVEMVRRGGAALISELYLGGRS